MSRIISEAVLKRATGTGKKIHYMFHREHAIKCFMARYPENAASWIDREQEPPYEYCDPDTIELVDGWIIYNTFEEMTKNVGGAGI